MKKIQKARFNFYFGLVLVLTACSPARASVSDTNPLLVTSVFETSIAAIVATEIALESPPIVETTTIPPTPTVIVLSPTPTVEETVQVQMSPTPDTRPLPREWAGWPVTPSVSETAKEIYRDGIAKGTDPYAVSVIGDCQSEPDVFMGIYETDRNPLGSGEQQLIETVSRFAGSFSRQSLGVRDGMSAPTALSPLWSDKEFCEANESPLDCELRVRRPSIVFVNLGTNWKAGASAERYGEYLRQIVEKIIESGAVPILSTKADNVEGDHSINRVAAEVAYEYDIPLWNFWLAADSLPNHGLDVDRGNIYLTPLGWDRRNYTALQSLDAVWRALEAE